MRPPWKRRTPDNLAAAGDVDALLAALVPKPRDFIGHTEEFYDVGWQRRASAAEHLADVPGLEVTSGLATALADVAPDVRMQALRSLVGRADAPADAMVLEVLGWPEHELRETAESLLGERAGGDPSASARMLDGYVAAEGARAEFSDDWVRAIVESADPDARRAVVERAARDAVTSEPGVPRLSQVLAAAAADAASALVPALSDEATRPNAIRLLGHVRHDGATSALLQLIDDPAPEVRRAAAVALGQIKDPRAIDALLRHTADEDYDVRDAALGALDGFGTAAVVWGLASVARGVLTSVTGDDWMGELGAADPREIPQLPVVRTDHVDAEADEVIAEVPHDSARLVEEPTSPADERTPTPLDGRAEFRQATAGRRRRGFWR